MGVLAPQKTIGIKYIEPQRLRRKQKQKIAMCHRTAEQKNFAARFNIESCVNGNCASSVSGNFFERQNSRLPVGCAFELMRAYGTNLFANKLTYLQTEK